MIRIAVLFAVVLICCASCTISFTPGTVDYTKIKTFEVNQFETRAGEAPATAGQQFSEQLKDKVINNTRLRFVPNNGDVTFAGAISQYSVSPIAPKANETVSLQRLKIAVSVTYTNEREEDKNWTQSFNRFADFSAEASLFDVQDQLIEQIYDEIMEDLFNKAFADW